MIHRYVRQFSLLPLCICGCAYAAQPPDGVSILKGQQKFLDASIQMCRERVPALGADLAEARNHAEREISKAERLISDAMAPTIKSDQRYLDLYADMWSRSADTLIEGLEKQDASQACPTLVANWRALEADVIVEDWENFFGRYSAEAEEPAADAPAAEAR